MRGEVIRGDDAMLRWRLCESWSGSMRRGKTRGCWGERKDMELGIKKKKKKKKKIEWERENMVEGGIRHSLQRDTM